MSLFTELKRRNVFRMAVLYVVAAWLVMQVAEAVITLADPPAWSGRLVLAVLAIGFPIALVFSWLYELTPEGIALEKDVDRAESTTHITARRMDFVVIAMLVAALLLFAWHTWWPPDPIDRSVAVMDFDNLGGDPEQGYFSAGISEDLRNLLASTPDLRVTSRESVEVVQQKGLSIPEIGEELEVSHVLQGTVQRDGDRVRIRAQLIDAARDSVLWSVRFDRELVDIFTVQDEIALAIAESLKLEMALASREPLPREAITSGRSLAYDAYLQGRELTRQRDRENLEEAVRHLERSLGLDYDFAPAHAQLAIATTLLVERGAYSREETQRRALLHIDRALELQPDLAEAHGALALLALLVTNNSEYVVEHAGKALTLNPNYAEAMFWSYLALNRLGRYAEADEFVMKMREVDPLMTTGRFAYAEWLSLHGRTDEAHAVADRLLEQSPFWGYATHAAISSHSEGDLAGGLRWGLQHDRERGRSSHYVGFPFQCIGSYAEARRAQPVEDHWVMLAEGRHDEAVDSARSMLRADPSNPRLMADAADILFIVGQIGEALPLYEAALASGPTDRPVTGPVDLIRTMRLAHARRNAGDEAGALVAADLARREHAAREASGRVNWALDLAAAMIAAFDGQEERAIAALGSAVDHGLRIDQFFLEAVFENLWNKPGFIAVQNRLEMIIADEREKILQLVCFDNPTPNHWQPLPETCEGVVARRH